MDNYKQIAVRYLKLNKKRSLLTVIGVTVAVTVLYAALNLGWSVLLTQRENLRDIQDYEILFLTETEEQIEQLIADDRVKSAYIGQYYDNDYYEPVMYERALYINTTNPYRMEAILNELENAYGVEGKMNLDLAATYMQGEDDNMTVILILFTLLVSFIFAIFGVGIVRNSIQLSILEQIKDYGNMRCVGSTKEQLKTVVYIQGAILELTGNAIGIVLGFIVSFIIGHLLKWKVGFHLLPMVPILIAFLGDLYFAMEENCKVIVNLTPVSAIRGEYRIHKEKIKARRRSIFGKFFGVEGDYAYKSIMRNPGRFHKTVWALGIGMAAFIAIMSGTATINGFVKEMKERYGYYFVYFENMLDTSETKNELQSNLPSTSLLEEVANMKGVTEAKRIYSAQVLLGDYEEHFSHYTEDYLKKTDYGTYLNISFSSRDKMSGDISMFTNLTEVACYGYDETDYLRYQSALVDGTLDISENGLVLVNEGNVEQNYDADLVAGYMDVVYTDYKVGDTIDIVDMGRYRTMITERLEKITEEYERELSKLPKLSREQIENTAAYEASAQSKLRDTYNENRLKAVKECREQMIAEGAYKTYTIEGIVNKDVNRHGSETIGFVLPLEQYYALTGTDESMVTGMQYHFDKFSATRFFGVMSANESGQSFFSGEAQWSMSAYPTMMQLIERLKDVSRGGMLFVVFVVSMTTFNIINTTASNLHLRRKEFAQLRVIGVSKKRLMKMVMLEGVISSLVANIIGIILGVLLSFISMGMVLIIAFGATMKFPALPALIGIVVSTLIICGSIYVPLRGLKQDMAADLATGGD